MKKLQDAIFSSGERACPQNCYFLLLPIFFMPEKADFSSLCQPTIGAHGGRLVEHGAAV
jgi:hypothetical protein